ncbi:hypothetical protein HPB49_015441 [Dermacentor silvarum]|uniref:Uncharacterized protein n=1 Tax=Dermacentor silvarum TaxID=543639 RepID=A0ACB8DJL4_DERSI|nr:hypothetical protein HPB49_015441 [Dermacentor silvarum]
MRSRIGGLALTVRTAGVLCLLLKAGAMAVPQSRELPTLREVQFWNKPPVHSRNEQCPQGEDTVTFEKTVAMKPGSRRLSPMFAPREDFRSRGAVTLDCLRRCQASPRCLGVVVNYEHNACFAATALDDEDVANTLGSTTDQPPLVPASDRSNYFAKMCVHGPACDKDWVMERVPDKELRGFDDRVVSGVPSCQRCQELCLHEASFPCRSGEFDARARECRLSSQDRRSQPSAFGPAQGPHMHYFENLCLPPSSGHAANCDFELHKDVDLRRADQVRSAFSADQCRSMCETCREFTCRSYSFAPGAGVCAMSGDDTVSLGGFALRMTPGVGFYQRPTCPEPVQLSCTRESMALTLHTKDPFAGRIYPRDETAGCDVQGRGSRETTLVMGLMDRRCGVSEDDRGRFTSTIVIQQHPVIQQKGDRIVKLFCIFDTGNRTVTNTYKVLVGGVGTASRVPGVVNATAPSPNVRLRITDRAGVDVAGAKLGDELFLRIEMDDDSVFGLFARNLVATSGQNDDSIVLIDSAGCPTDRNIFPALEKLPGDKTRTLQSRFEAFKFADDVVVRFQVTVQFCLHECPPATCASAGARSFGKRRRRRRMYFQPLGLQRRMSRRSVVAPPVTPTTSAASNATLASAGKSGAVKKHILPTMPLPEYPLQREIIVQGIGGAGTDSGVFSSRDRRSDSRMVCATPSVLTAAVVAAFPVQLALIAACLSCVALARRCGEKRRGHVDDDEEDDEVVAATPSSSRVAPVPGATSASGLDVFLPMTCSVLSLPQGTSARSNGGACLRSCEEHGSGEDHVTPRGTRKEWRRQGLIVLSKACC